MLGNSQFFKIKVYLTRTKNYKKSQPFLGKVNWTNSNPAFGFRLKWWGLLIVRRIGRKAEGRKPDFVFCLETRNWRNGGRRKCSSCLFLLGFSRIPPTASPPTAFSTNVRMCGCGNSGKPEKCWCCGESAHPHIRTLVVKCPKMVDPVWWCNWQMR